MKDWIEGFELIDEPNDVDWEAVERQLEKAAQEVAGWPQSMKDQIVHWGTDASN